jgi:hypothetical protein
MRVLNFVLQSHCKFLFAPLGASDFCVKTRMKVLPGNHCLLSLGPNEHMKNGACPANLQVFEHKNKCAVVFATGWFFLQW